MKRTPPATPGASFCAEIVPSMSKEKAPEGITVVGGKTGTTGAAGYCLVLYSYNASGQPIVSIVLKADGKSNLYLLMNEMLSGFAN